MASSIQPLAPMPTDDEKRNEHAAAALRERRAYERRQRAIAALEAHHKRHPGVANDAVLEEALAAEREWRAATAAVDRIAAEDPGKN